MGSEGQATEAVRLVAHWYREHIDTFVAEGRGERTRADGPILAVAHELAWRRAIVTAARASDPDDWRAMTVVHEAAIYEHLLGWTATTYEVPEDDVRAAQTRTGYRKQPR